MRSKIKAKHSIISEERRWHDIAYGIMLALLYAVSSFMFYRQSIRYNGGYPADTSAYVKKSIEHHGVRLITWIYHWLYSLRGDTVLIAIYMGLVVMLTAAVNYAVIRWYHRDRLDNAERLYAQVASLVMFVTGSMYIPGIHEQLYKASWCTYAWHSPTQQLMILFAMLSLLLFLRIYDNYMERIDPLKWIALLITSTISVWAKPSFMLVFIPTVIITFLIELARHAREGNSGRRFLRLFLFGLSMVPAGILILLLNSSIYGEGSENKVAVNVGGAAEYNVYIAAFCGLLFPAIVILFNLGRLRELPIQISIGMLFFGIAEWAVFHEVGTRGAHGNFAWGRQFGCYYFFLIAGVIAYNNYKDKDFLGGRRSARALYFAILAIALAAHVLTQTYHFYLMFRGHDFYQ